MHEKELDEIAVFLRKKFEYLDNKELIDSLDTINTTDEKLNDIFTKMSTAVIDEKSEFEEYKNSLCIPFIQNCSIITDSLNYAVFSELTEENRIKAKVIAYAQEMIIFNLFFEFEPNVTFGDFSVYNTGYSDVVSTMLRENNTKENYIKKYQKKKYKEVFDFSVLRLMSLFTYINYLSEHPEIKVIERKQRENKQSSVMKSKIKKDNKDKSSVILNGIKIVVKEEKTAKALKSKVPRKLYGSWAVRGHYRHYKNGKTVYIKPYQKGKDVDKRIKKMYKFDEDL